MRSSIIAVFAAAVTGTQAQAFTLLADPTATAAIAYQASQFLSAPGYSAAEGAVYSAAQAYYQTASRSIIPDNIIASAVPSSQWALFTSVRGIQNALNAGSDVATGTGSASGTGSVSASATSAASQSAASSAASTLGSASSASASGASGASSASKISGTVSSTGGAARATGMAMGAAAGIVAGIAYAV